MPNCPKCQHEISTLKCYARAEVLYFVTVANGEPCYERKEFYEVEDDQDKVEDQFDCPVCARTLFTNETDAVKFLKEV